MLTTIREEQLLAKFAGEDVAVPQPCTRTEKFLAKMAGLDVQTPTPITREEQILNKIAEGGGGGGSETIWTLLVNSDAFEDALIPFNAGADHAYEDDPNQKALWNYQRVSNIAYLEYAAFLNSGLTDFPVEFVILNSHRPVEFGMQIPTGATVTTSGAIVGGTIDEYRWQTFTMTGDATITIRAGESGGIA